MTVRFGVQLWGTDFDTLLNYALECERLGYDSLRYGDGLWDWTLEGWTVLAALAAATRTIRIGPAVTYVLGDAYRHPSLLAKTVTTLDLISKGRIDLRLGVGTNDAEAARCWESFGISYPRPGTRVSQLKEGIQIIKTLWTDKPAHFEGQHFRLKAARLGPPPIQTPHPPIWVAAMSRRALGVAVELADGWETSYLSPDAFGRKAGLVQSLCDESGRDFKTLRRSLEVDVVIERNERTALVNRFAASRRIGTNHPLIQTAVIGDQEGCLEKLAAFVQAGVTDFTLSFLDYPRSDMLRSFAEAILPKADALSQVG